VNDGFDRWLEAELDRDLSAVTREPSPPARHRARSVRRGPRMVLRTLVAAAGAKALAGGAAAAIAAGALAGVAVTSSSAGPAAGGASLGVTVAGGAAGGVNPPGGGDPGAGLRPVWDGDGGGGGCRWFRLREGQGHPGNVSDVRRARRCRQPRSVGRSRRRPRGRRNRRRCAHPGDRRLEPTWTEHLPGHPRQVRRRPPLSSALVPCPELAVPPTTATRRPGPPVGCGAAASA
jgi:hypothetical protein